MREKKTKRTTTPTLDLLEVLIERGREEEETERGREERRANRLSEARRLSIEVGVGGT